MPWRYGHGLYPVPYFGQLLCAISQGRASELKREETPPANMFPVSRGMVPEPWPDRQRFGILN